MELLKRNITMNQQKCKSNLQITLDDDFNVPDIKPDIDKIVKEQGSISVREITPMNDRFLIKGALEFNLLYVSQETQRPVHNINGSLPFEETVNMEGVCGEEAIAVRWTLDDMSTSLINSRKISVKAIVNFDFVAENLIEEETAVEVTEDEDVQFISQTLNITQAAISKKDTFRIKDEIILPMGKDNIEEILYSEMDFFEGETKVLEDKITVRGLLRIFILYAGENESRGIQSFEAELPVSGSLDCSGCKDNMVSDIVITISNKDVEVKPDDDGEERILDLEVVLNLDIKIYEEEEMEVLKDLYSTQNQLDIKKKTAQYRNLLIKNSSKLRVVETIALDPGQLPILQICSGNGTVKIDEETRVENGILVEGVAEIQILYITEEDAAPIGAMKGVIPFSQTIEVKDLKDSSIYEIKGWLDQLGMVLIDGREIEVKATVGLEAIVFDVVNADIITDVTVLDNLEGLRQGLPSIAGYMVKKGDTLWDIAKEFYTTIDAIKELNDLDRDSVDEGQKLIICK